MAVRVAQTAIFGVIGAGGIFLLKEKYVQKNTVKASWTTHHNTPEPQYKWDYNWDRRQPVPKSDKVDASGDNNSTEESKPKAARHIILIRHGHYHMEGKTDEEHMLTELGKEQAHITGLRLKELNYPITRIVYSTMTRAQETGRIISSQLPENIPVEHCSLLIEGAPIPPEPPIGHWAPEARQFYEDGARIEAAFRKYFHRADASQKENSYEVLVCHANVIRYFACRALQLPPEAWLRISLHHGSMTFITIGPTGRVSLRALGECGFMDPDKLTTACAIK